MGQRRLFKLGGHKFKMFSKIREFLKNKIIKTVEDPAPVKEFGTYGRLEIPELKIAIPVNLSNGNAQKVVDARNSAVYIKWPFQEVIVDHVSQGCFWNLNLVQPGHTKANIIFENGDHFSLICTQIQTGHIIIENGKNKLYDEKWDPFRKQNAGGWVIYTCKGFRHGNIQDITLTYWRRK